MTKKIAFQGHAGAYSDMACRTVCPDMKAVPCKTFTDVFTVLDQDMADYAMIPIDNAIAGRVADIHHLLPAYNFYIQQEYFMPIHHCLLAPSGANLDGIGQVYSHVHALPQCRKFIRKLDAEEIVYGDTALSAQKVSEMKDVHAAAIASTLAAELYGLEILAENIGDRENNTTRFILLSKTERKLKFDKTQKYITSLLFRTRNIPAALYKSLGGFATNNINLIKLESYMVDGMFNATQFYCEVEAHPDEKNLEYALKELDGFVSEIKTLGTYVSDPARGS